MTVDIDILEHKKLFEELREFAEVDVEEGLSLVTIIGNKVNHTPGFTMQIFDSLQDGDRHLSVRAIFQGASKHSVGVMIADTHSKLAVERLHKTFIEEAGKR
jgi:aspartate kinase